MLNTFAPVPSSIELKDPPALSRGSSVIVVGAGAFGGWTALSLLRCGIRVTLVDAWGPGNARSSSGDETRVIRSTYGGNEFYFDLNVRALQLWKEHEKRWNQKVFHNTGVLWLCYDASTPLVDDSIPFARKHRMDYEYLDPADLQKRFPEIRSSDLHHAWLDPWGGFLLARESCRRVCTTFIEEGGRYVQASVEPIRNDGKINSISLTDGSVLTGDVFLFACGSWLGKLFPEILGQTITCTKQEVYYFGVPQERAGALDALPVWVDVDGKDFYYGIPANAQRGFKIGVDRRGKSFDPTQDDHHLEPEVLAHARKFIEHRFPAMKNAPLIENRVCPYENSPDGNFIFQKHPLSPNVLFLGGGSGHGFKHGPALGELVARTLTGAGG